MIGIKTEGRLGNQMFQFAFALKASKHLSTSFFLDKPDKLSCFKLLKNFGFQNRLNRLKSAKAFYAGEFDYNIEIEKQPVDFSNLRNMTLYKGYYQSLEFFYDIQDDVRECFKLKDKYVSRFQKKYGHYFEQSKTIVIHLRRTDYANFFPIEKKEIKYALLPIEYYLSCLDKIPDINQYKVLFIGDDPQFIKANFLGPENFFMIHDHEYMDFQCLLKADILIISNSTFAWWGAYLNSNRNKKVFAPKNWLAYHGDYCCPYKIFNQLDWQQVHHLD